MSNKKDSLGDRLEKITAFSDEQLQVLCGALLGDGSLIMHKHCTNAIFQYSSKSRQHVEFVALNFSDFLTDKGVYDCSSFDKRTEKVYYRSVAKTHVHPLFTEMHKMWYKDGKKHIPEDLILTPLICLIWYIGDGAICNNKRTQNIKLATQCFQKEELENILLPQLKNFEATLMKADVSKSGEQQYSIYIPKRKIKEFLDYIGPCPFPDYEYKWAYKEYKNFTLSKHPGFIRDLTNYFNMGMSSNTIAKLLNVDRTTVVKYLTLNEMNYKDNLFNKVKVGEKNEK